MIMSSGKFKSCSAQKKKNTWMEKACDPKILFLYSVPKNLCQIPGER